MSTDTGTINNMDGQSFKDETDLSARVLTLKTAFSDVFGAALDLIVRSPGRAEIIGNHTDYNNGYALAAAISRSLIIGFKKRPDNLIQLYSDVYPGNIISFSIGKIEKDDSNFWTNYPRAVVQELIKSGRDVCGANIYISSNLPSSGGVSSSAALELGIAVGLLSLAGEKINLLETALLCKQAENGPLVNSPCGLLDQAAVALAESGKMVFLDFMPQESSPIGVRVINADLAAKGYSFVVTVDPKVKRNLGATGYPARRAMCEQSVPILSALLDKKIGFLRDVSTSEYELIKSELSAKGGDIMRKRVEHVVYENQRVIDAAKALEEGDVINFGRLLSESGHSALELYELADQTPELIFLANTQRSIPCVTGIRNMGGGFCANTLALLPKKDVAAFEEEVARRYFAEYGRDLMFIDFQTTQGVEVL